MKTKNLNTMVDELKKQKNDNSYSVKDIMTEISDRIFLDINKKLISCDQAIYINKK